jgi:hypothetical protein
MRVRISPLNGFHHRPDAARVTLVGLCVGLLAAGCAPKIGDSCSSPIDCSITGDRLCDRTQPGGYCTVQFCNPDTCPDDAVCVEWRYDPPRTAETWCMKRCQRDRDCRSAYRCVGEDDPALVGPNGESLARVVDIEDRGDPPQFCAAFPVVADEPQEDAAVPDTDAAVTAALSEY